MSKQVIAIKTDGTAIQITLPKDPNEEHNFIMSFIGDNPQPTEMFFSESTEVIWTIPSSKNYFKHPENHVATLLTRNLYDRYLGILRGNVLITGIGAKDGMVASINPANIGLIISHATGIKQFLTELDTYNTTTIKENN